MTTTLADRLLAADDALLAAKDPPQYRLAALAYAAAWHEVNGAGLRADEADALVRARADLAAMTTERDEAVAHGRAVYDLARSDERKAWQDATGCDTPADVRAVEREVMSGSPGSLADAARHLRRFLTAESEQTRRLGDGNRDLHVLLGMRLGDGAIIDKVREVTARAEAAEREVARLTGAGAVAGWAVMNGEFVDCVVEAKHKTAADEIAQKNRDRIAACPEPHMAATAKNIHVAPLYLAHGRAASPPPDASESDEEIARALMDVRAASVRHHLPAWNEQPANAQQAATSAVRAVIRPRLDALRAEVARLATALATAEQEVHRVAVSAAEVTRERDAFIETTNCVTAKEAGESIDRFVAEIAAVKARQAQSDSAATDACRYLDCSAADLLATVTSLYETRGGLVAEVADLRAKLVAAESEAHRVAVAAAEVTAERDALEARVAALEAVVKAAASTLHVYVGEDFEVCRVCGIEDAKADHVDLDAYARGRDAADPVTVPAPDRAEELIIAQYDGCRKVAAELGHDGNWYAWGEWVKVHPRARHIQVESMRRALASLATPSPRYVAVKRDEVNGRPASWFHTEAEAERYVALCNDNPDLFGADDEIEGALESYTHAVVDTCATPPALPQVEAFELPAVEWTRDEDNDTDPDDETSHTPVEPAKGARFVVVRAEDVGGRPAEWKRDEKLARGYADAYNAGSGIFNPTKRESWAMTHTHAVVDTGATPPAALPQVEAFGLPAVEWTEEVGGGAERSVGARHRAVACGDGSWRLTIDGKTTSSAESKARVEAAVAVLAGRAEARR